MPSIHLQATSGETVDVGALAGRAVLFFYPYTGKPGTPNPPGWDDIAGAHGSTPQALAYSKAYGDFVRFGVKVFGISLQDRAWQQDFVSRNGLAFPLLSDAGVKLTKALGLATFSTGGVDYLVRRSLAVADGMVTLDRNPVPEPEADAAVMLAHVREGA